MRLLLAALFLSQAAHADSLTINTADITLYYVGTGLTIEGHSASMTVTAVAEGDHPGQMFIDSFEAQPWVWHLMLNGQQIDGAALCTAVGDLPTLTLNCD